MPNIALILNNVLSDSGVPITSNTSGTSGTTGTSGSSGTTGTSGTSGTSGINGTSGTSGINGTSGTSGVSGTSGTSGTTGTSGTSGVNGTSGTTGTSGTSGVSPTLSGTTNTVAKFTSASAIGNSNITDSGTLITLGSNTTISSGGLGIGTTSLTGTNLNVSKNITGATSSGNFSSQGAIQSDVTVTGFYYNTLASTQAATFTLNSIVHYLANQGTIGAGSTVNNQYGFRVLSSLTGATNNYAYHSDIAAGTNRWNLYMIGTANNYLAGSLGIGTTSLTGNSLVVAKQITGTTSSNGIIQFGSVQSDVTANAYGIRNDLYTAASAFTLGNYFHFFAQQASIGAGSAIGNQYGFYVSSNLTGASNDYGFYGNLAAATGVWNFYMGGSANNYMAGSLGIGATSLTGYNLRIQKTITGAVFGTSILNDGVIQSDVTSAATYYQSTASTQAATFTVGSVYHYLANQGTFGAGSTITNQIGFYANSNLIGATTNVGFYGDIASGTGRWNLYMNGTASNYIAGSLGLGTTSPGGKLAVTGDILCDTNINAAASYYIQVRKSRGSIASPSNIVAGDVVGGLLGLGYEGGSYRTGAAIQFNAESVSSGAVPMSIRFYSGGGVSAGTERMRITADNGNVCIGTTDSAHPLNILAKTGFGIKLIADATTDASNITFFPNTGLGAGYASIGANSTRLSISSSNTTYLDMGGSGGGIRIISSSGRVLIGSTTDQGAYLLQVNSQIWATNSTIATSDLRLKENVADLDSSLNLLMGMKSRTFTYKQNTEYNFTEKGVTVGFVAQELKELLEGTPYANSIVVEAGKYYGVAYEKIIPLLVKGIQELKSELDTLKNK